MARITSEEAKKYSVGNNLEWFSLKNDGDVARVQFMFADCSEIEIFTAHKISYNGKDRYVNCPREYNDSIDICPLCANGNQIKVVRYIFLYCLDDNTVKVWERGSTFMQKLEGLSNRYYPLNNTVFEIERHGKAGDKQTSYEIFPCPDVKPVDISEIEKPEILGGLILDKSFDELDYFAKTGSFPSADDSEPKVTYERRARVIDDKVNTPTTRTSSRCSRRG